MKTKWARADGGGGSVFAELWVARRTGCKILVREEKCRKRGEERKEGRKEGMKLVWEGNGKRMIKILYRKPVTSTERNRERSSKLDTQVVLAVISSGPIIEY